MSQRIEKVNNENLLSKGTKLEDKKKFNCFEQKEDEDVDCRLATFQSDIHFYGQYTIFALAIAAILNMISYVVSYINLV